MASLLPPILYLFLITLINADPLRGSRDYPGHIKYETVADKTDGDVEQLFERFVKDYDRSYTLQAEEFLLCNKMGEMLAEKSDQPRHATTMSRNKPLPDFFDWRQKNIVSSVKIQGVCNSCWAFTAAGNIEGQWALKHQQLYNLSVQQILDCDKQDSGCLGGSTKNAFQAIEKFGGLEQDEDYAYTASRGECKMDASKVVAKITNWTSLSTNETELAYWLLEHGPIGTALDATLLPFYKGGIYKPIWPLCSRYFINHGVLLVGFGNENGLPYWIVKNSWGTGWGEQGYFRIFRGGGTCGINERATTSFV